MQPLVGNKVHSWARRSLLGLLLVVLLSLQPLQAADLTLTETTKLDFGSVVDLSGDVTVGLNDDVISDPTGIQVGDPVTTGEFLITGDPFASFSLSILGSTVAGLGIGQFETSDGTPPLLNAALDATGQLLLRLGAQLTVNDATAAPGLNQPLLFTITLNYN